MAHSSALARSALAGAAAATTVRAKPTSGSATRGERHRAWHWTRKVAAKTVGRWLSAEQADDYRAWIDNDRRIRELVGRLEAIGIAVIDTDPRTARGRRVPP